MKLAIFMDELSSLNLKTDSTLLMIQRAQSMGWNCVFFTAKDLWYEDGVAYANVFSIALKNIINAPMSSLIDATCNLGAYNLSDFDIILIRKDPPFDAEYIYATYILELAEKNGVLVSNKPQSLRDANEKMFAFWFSDCCPPTIVSSNLEQLRGFWSKHRHVIFKPLHGMGGHGIFEVNGDGHNLSVIIETLTQDQSIKIMAQKYIPEIRSSGDKRIILINGEPVSYALARVPASGEVRGNLKAGGSGHVVSITDRDRWLCSQVGPSLQSKGLNLVGLDVIGEYITEINVTSPTCLRNIEDVTGLDIAGQYLNSLALKGS